MLVARAIKLHPDIGPALSRIPISKHVHVHDNAAFYHDDNTLRDESHF